MILSLLFFALAAMCNSIMDNTKDHFYKSIFNSPKFDQNWWNTETSWKNKYIDRSINKGVDKSKPIFLTDSWHYFKFLMVVLLALSAATFDIKFLWWEFPLIIISYGIVWIAVFNFFYNKILNKF